MLLDSFERQTHRDFEVIVIDQNEDLELTSVLAGRGFPLCHIRSKQGASLARNVGLRAASGDIIAFPDDDCCYRADTLAMAKSFFMANPQADAVIGKWKCCRREEVGRYGVFRRAGTCFFFVRRHWLERVVGFDEMLGPGPGVRFQGGEDTDFLLQGMKAGLRVFRDPDIVVEHPDLPADRVALSKAEEYGRARMAVLRKHSFPVWFKVVNVIFPLMKFIVHPKRDRISLSMFMGRLKGLVEK